MLGSAGTEPPSTFLPPFRCTAAAIARRVYIRQGLGVGMFRKIFGGRSNKKGAVCPEHFAKGAVSRPGGRAALLEPKQQFSSRLFFRTCFLHCQQQASCRPGSAQLMCYKEPRVLSCACESQGGVIRHALHNLETLGLVEKNPGAKGGRRCARPRSSCGARRSDEGV